MVDVEAFFNQKICPHMTNPFKNRYFNRPGTHFSCNSRKTSIISNRKSTTRFLTSLRSAYVTAEPQTVVESEVNLPRNELMPIAG